MVNYEVMFIVNPEIGEEAAAACVEKIKTLIEANATVDHFDAWGASRQFAYPINDVESGTYYLTTFAAEPEFPAELERIFRITEGILRFLIINKDAE